MLKFLSITLLFFILLVNSTTVFADSESAELKKLLDFSNHMSNRSQEIQKLYKQQQEIIISIQKEIDEIKKSKDNESKKREEQSINLTIKLQEIDELQRKINNEFRQQIDELNYKNVMIIKILSNILNNIQR